MRDGSTSRSLSLGSLRSLLEAAAAPPELGELHPGAVLVDRFEILRLAGMGGMGVVWHARDRSLSRDVAIKVCARHELGATDRVLDEATAMAQLSHPNVVTVHELVADRGAVLIVMEWVDGKTLRAWLEEDRRPWREVTRAYLAAGEGLAAVHAAGLVHRDVKPDNILVGRDGRVRLADLGLAGTGGASQSVRGTPAYMPPEQAAGGAVDARSNLYSFAASLHEGVSGVRPAIGRPLDATIPRRLRSLLARALDADPARRPASMTAFLGELRRAAAPIQVWRWAAPVAAATAALTVAVIWMRPQSPRAACENAALALGESWSSQRRAEVERAFTASGRPWAAAALQSTLRGLDAHREHLVDAGRAACDATHVRGSQSAELFNLRMACLEQRGAGMAALVALLAEARPEDVENAPRAVESLPRVEVCASDLRGAAVPAKPEAVAAVRQVLAAGDAYAKLGSHGRAALVLAAATPSAEVLGHPPLLAETLYADGTLADDRGDRARAEPLLRRAVFVAETARRDDVKAGALARLGYVMANAGGRAGETRTVIDLADAAVQRAGGDPALQVQVANTRASLAYIEGQGEDAIKFARRALALAETAYGPQSVDVGQRRRSLGGILALYATTTEAMAEFRAALPILETHYGKDHISVARVHMNMASELSYAGENAAGSTEAELALATARRALGDDAPDLWAYWNTAGETRVAVEKWEDAEAAYLRARVLAEKRYGDPSVATATVDLRLGSLLNLRKRSDEALVVLRRAIAALEATQQRKSMTYAVALNNLGRTLEAAGRLDEAQRAFEDGLAAHRAIVGADSPEATLSLMSLGRLEKGRGRLAEARKHFEEVLRVRRKGLPVGDAKIAAVAFALAEVHPDAKAARALAEEARAIYNTLEDPNQVAEIDRWLAALR